MLGIALGVAALIIVLSVMNGFQKEIRARMLGITPHLQVVSDSGSLLTWQSTLDMVTHHPAVVSAAPYVSGQQERRNIRCDSRQMLPAGGLQLADWTGSKEDNWLLDLRTRHFVSP